jgi:tripartite-type tricarboxylate transporter receptor subunit TctC
MVPQLQSGHALALAVNANTRSPLFPSVPTIAEATGDVLPQSWFGLFAPAGTPKPIINKLAAEVAAITSEPTFHRKVYIDRAVERAVDTPAAFARFILQDRATAARIVKESGVQPE